MMTFDAGRINDALTLLGELLASEGLGPYRVAVCGGAALIACALVSRTTIDVDVVAMLDENAKLVSPDPMPPDLLRLSQVVQRNLDLPDNWLNNGPSREPGGLFQVGLPQGFAQRLVSRDFGPSLTVFFPDRIDQIHFKVFAAVDSGPGRHTDDLLNLKPTSEEMEAASRWAMNHDPSPGFRLVLMSMLQKLGYKDVAERL
jgi:hypothetical protein